MTPMGVLPISYRRTSHLIIKNLCRYHDSEAARHFQSALGNIHMVSLC
jgi:hypothetical protein